MGFDTAAVFPPQRDAGAAISGAGAAPRGGPFKPPLPSGARPRRAGKMAAAGRAWRAAALLPAWRLRAPGRAYGAAAGGGGSGGGRLLLGAAFALGGGAGLYLAARHRLWEHSAAEVTRCRAPLAASRPLPRGSSRRHPRVGHRARSLSAPRGGCGRFLLALGTKRVVLLLKSFRGGPGMSVSESSLGWEQRFLLVLSPSAHGGLCNPINSK